MREMAAGSRRPPSSTTYLLPTLPPHQHRPRPLQYHAPRSLEQVGQRLRRPEQALSDVQRVHQFVVEDGQVADDFSFGGFDGVAGGGAVLVETVERVPSGG